MSNEAKKLSPVGRVSFPRLFEPQVNDQGHKTWSLVLVFDKKAQSTPEYATMLAAIDDTATERFGQKVPSGVKRKSLEPKSGYPITLCSAKEEYFGWAEEGAVMVTFSSRYTPLVIDRDKTEILEADDLYGGCYARVSFTTYAYDSQGNQGVSFGLRAVQKAKDGERFGGAKASAQEFDELKEDF
jgi:hypothetical protein